jgi:hypothetical protein
MPQIARNASMMSVLNAIVNLIKGPEQNDNDEKWVELHIKVRSIQARIERLRKNFHPHESRIQRINEEVEKLSPNRETNPRPTEREVRDRQRNAELDDLKKKLTRGKK